MFKCAFQTITELTVERLIWIDHYRDSQIFYILIMLLVEETDHTTSVSPPYS